MTLSERGISCWPCGAAVAQPPGCRSGLALFSSMEETDVHQECVSAWIPQDQQRRRLWGAASSLRRRGPGGRADCGERRGCGAAGPCGRRVNGSTDRGGEARGSTDTDCPAGRLVELWRDQEGILRQVRYQGEHAQPR